jgi:hypothetical protein
MAWILSAMSIAMLWMMGNKSKYGPILGLVNQVAWVWYAVSLEQWGLLPGVAGFTIVHIRNLYKWSKADKDEAKDGGGYIDEFFGDRDVITSEQGVYLKPVGKAEDNPFDPPGYPRSFINHRPNPTDDPPTERTFVDGVVDIPYFVDERIPEIDNRRPINITLEEWEKLSPNDQYSLVVGKNYFKRLEGRTWD